jgi:hypothetical protein
MAKTLQTIEKDRVIEEKAGGVLRYPEPLAGAVAIGVQGS